MPGLASESLVDAGVFGTSLKPLVIPEDLAWSILRAASRGVALWLRARTNGGP